MKPVSAPIKTTIEQGTAIRATPRLIVEWNQNRYAATVTAKNGNDIPDGDPDIYPIDSIIQSDRPARGVLKARTGSPELGYESYLSSSYADSPSGARYYVSSPDSKYKYWASPTRSAGGTYSTNPAAITNCTPTVLYSENRWTNKIVIGFENTFASPSAYTIEVTYNGTTWNTIATTPAIDAEGRVILYRQANDTWGATQYLNNPVLVRGVRVNVTQMNKSNVYFYLIEISARVESDLSAYVEDFNAGLKMADRSFVLPLGRPTPQDGSISLSNVDARFSNDNSSSLYYGLLDSGARCQLDIGITNDPYTTASPTYEWIRVCTMRSDTWAGQNRKSTSISLKDDSVILQTVKPNPILYMDITVGEIFWRILDSIGYTNYHYETNQSDPASLIPYFWIDGEQTVWDIFADLAESSQTAIYFDEYGVLQIRPRSAALQANQTPVWQFDAEMNGLKLPDIIELEKTIEYEANMVNVVYKDTKISEEGAGLPALETVWEPEDVFVVRASSLSENLLAAGTTMKITATEAANWPYEGVVQIEGELIRYSKKQYFYHDANNVLQNKYIKDVEEKNALDKLSTLNFKNYFSGRFDITGGRGQFNTVADDHYVDLAAYSARYRTSNGPLYTWLGGRTHNTEDGLVRLATNSTFSTTAWYTMYRNVSPVDEVMKWYGTRVRFPAGAYTYGAAGLVISQGSNDSGYYIELANSNMMTDARRAVANEVNFYVRKTDGTLYRANAGAGWTYGVAQDNWYDIDVTVISGGSDTRFRIFINGQPIGGEIIVPAANRPMATDQGTFGLFVRGYTVADFEYVYASKRPSETPSDEGGFLDRIRGGYQSSQYDRELVYDRIEKRVNGKTVYAAFNQQFLDDFGPVVHEVREMDVKFTKVPVLHSRLYMTNDYQAFCPEYLGDPFGARFMIVNASRENAVLNGEDTLTFAGEEASLDQRMMIYGRVLIQEDGQKVTSSNQSSIRRRGEIVLDIESPWIQTASAAKKLGEWINLHWSDGCDELSISCFGNPLLQIGDTVAVNYPELFYWPEDYKYFVVEISHNWSNGLETSVVLRRNRI